MTPDLTRAEALVGNLASDGAVDLVIDVEPPGSDHTVVRLSSSDRRVVVTVPHDARTRISIEYAGLTGPVNAADDEAAAAAILRLIRAPRRPRGFLRQLLE